MIPNEFQGEWFLSKETINQFTKAIGIVIEDFILSYQFSFGLTEMRIMSENLNKVNKYTEMGLLLFSSEIQINLQKPEKLVPISAQTQNELFVIVAKDDKGKTIRFEIGNRIKMNSNEFNHPIYYERNKVDLQNDFSTDWDNF